MKGKIVEIDKGEFIKIETKEGVRIWAKAVHDRDGSSIGYFERLNHSGQSGEFSIAFATKSLQILNSPRRNMGGKVKNIGYKEIGLRKNHTYEVIGEIEKIEVVDSTTFFREKELQVAAELNIGFSVPLGIITDSPLMISESDIIRCKGRFDAFPPNRFSKIRS